MRLPASLLLVPWLMMMPVRGQNLKLPISNYTSKTYGREHLATNYCVITDLRNLVYAGNANGILEYDGSEWRFIPVRQGAYVTSLALAPSGTLFVGSQQEFGLLTPDPAGSLNYSSLSGYLPAEDRNFSDVWSVLANEEMTVFQAEEGIFIFSGDSLRSVSPETSFHTAFLVGDRLYARERGSGLKVYRNNSFETVPDGKKFAELGIFGMFPEGDRILIVTREKGFYLLDPRSGIERMFTDEDAFLIRSGIFGGTVLADGNIALNTMHEGVIIINPEGRILSVINKHAGLQENDVKDLWQDKYRNLWCALSSGISKIDYSSPLSYYDEKAGIEGSVHALKRFKGRLYVGTTSGLYVENKTSALNESLEFIPRQDMRDQVWCLDIIEGSLVAGTSNGLFVIRDGITRKVADINTFCMLYLEDQKILLAGGSGGLKAFSPGKGWKMIRDFDRLNLDVKAIARNRSTYYEATEIWIGSSLQGTVKLLLKPGLAYESVHYYGPADGLPEDWVLPFEHADSVVFGTREGILYFIDEQVVRQALPDSLKDLPEFNRGFFDRSMVYEKKSVLPLSFMADAGNRTWAVIDNEIILAVRSTSELIEKPFRGINMGEINGVYPDRENTVWFGTSEGLARFDISRMEQPVVSLQAAIRSVVISGDSLLFNGHYPLPEVPPAKDSGLLFRQPDEAVPVLDFAHNDLTFFFSSPFYDQEASNLFSWKLEGGKQGWSNWSPRRVASFTNLHEGEYTFLLRVKNIYEDISDPAGYRFLIRPPWYRTLPAYVLYLICLATIIFIAVRLGQRRLRIKNERLEAIVRERTEEIRHQNIELAAQKKEITDSIYYAERIQRAILPQTEKINENLEGHFILFRPKDIVSGDFYWLAENRDKIIVTAVDCTGHGVPGAFMSMLGVSFLNKIILENNIIKADQILNELRDNVVSALKQTGREGEARDGMDMALVVIDLKQMTMEFAGANNPLYMIREDQLQVTKADRMPIAYHHKSGKFTNHVLQLSRGDTFYLFSDGFADQFGGPQGKKFMYKSFKNLLLECRGKPMEEVRKILEDNLESWISPGRDESYEQVDDILVIGVRI